MTKISTLKKKWLENPEVKTAYDELAMEFEVAHKLIEERLKANLTQKEVADRMGTKQSVVARLESGVGTTIKTIERYAHALGKVAELRFKNASHH